METKFTHLHTHSHYSLLDGLAKIDELLNYAKELGMDSLALTDHGVLYGAVEFFQKAKKKNIKPIIGCEVYLALEKMTDRRPNIDDTRFHLVLLAKNETGYKNLVQLVTKAHLEGFYYKPRIDEELLAKHADGLIATSACLNGKIPKMVLANRLDEAKKTIVKYKEIFGDNFYLEIQHHPGNPEQQKVNDALIKFSRQFNIPLVATNDIHYLKKEDAEAQDILMMINTGSDPDDPERLSLKNDDYSMISPQEMAEFFKDVPEAISNTQKIVGECNFEFKFGEARLPHFPVPNGKTPDEFLRELTLERAGKKYKEITEEIKNRLEYELSVIEKTGFASYFLIVQDFVNWAKEHRIVVGPGRGSAPGSLVSYCLGITNVDPLKFKLLFERFLNPERISLPDIDLDFTDRRRDEVIEYVKGRYGAENVSQIITFGTIAARAVVRDVGRALKYPYSYCDRIAKLIPMNMSLNECLQKVVEFRQIYQTDPEAQKLIDFAKKLEGVARHASTHACCVVISQKPLTDLISLQHPSQLDNSVITQYEMNAIESLGLLKMDFLGLKNLTIIEDTLARIYKIRGESIDIDNIPLDDPKTFKIFQTAETTGVFQLECLSGDTIVSNTTIKKLFERKNKKILESVYLNEGKVHKNQIINVLESGEKGLYTLIAENNSYIKASKDHYFLTESGWKKLEDISAGERVLIKTKAKHLVFNICKICGEQISGEKEGRSNFCYECSARFYKNPSKKESREKIRKARTKFYQQGGKPWNYGITTKNNEIWRKTAEKISKALKGRTLEEIHGPERAKEIKKKLSLKSSGKSNPMFGKPSPHRKGGFRKDLGHYVRSNWEADFARILKIHNLKYKYEAQTFRLARLNGEIIHYTPDFYVRSSNTFYEIKGWMHELDKEKIKLFQEQYPQYNFVLVSATKFAEFALKYKTLINWECPQIPLKNSFQFVKIKKIEYSGREKTYDILMKAPGNNFVANSFLVHNSGGMKRHLRELKPTVFEDIIAMIALYRPGPMELIPEYIARKNGKKQIEYLHPKLEPILKETYGICIYQEQLLRIAQDLAGFTLGAADVLRKAVGKKIKELLWEQQDKFIQGCVNNNISKDVAEQLWQWILPFAKYGFNRSHAASYAMIAFQTAYLKAHYPLEFMASLLTTEGTDVERISVLIKECQKMGIQVLAPDINESFRFFSVVPEKNMLRFGLFAIKNVGENIVNLILEERKNNGPFKSIEDLVCRVDPKALNKKPLESLIKSGALDKFGDRGIFLENLEKILDFGRQSQKNKSAGQKNLFDAPNNGEATTFNSLKLYKAKQISQRTKLDWEKELLGLYLSGHPLDDYKTIIQKNATLISEIKKNIPANVPVKLSGIIAGIKKIITKNGKTMLFVQVEDFTDKIEVIAFPSIVDKNPLVFVENKIVILRGRVSGRDHEKKVVCEEIQELIERT